MKRTAFYRLIYGTVISLALMACGEDRSGEYYALIASKTWIYETMQQNYLFYEDIPAEESLDFFQTPENFLKNAASSRDQKNGTLFSHIDSVNVSRALSSSPTFGYEAALIRTGSGDYAIRVLYTQPGSPAEEAGLKKRRLDHCSQQQKDRKRRLQQICICTDSIIYLHFRQL